MANFTVKVDLIWMLDFANNYQFDRNGNCYNIKSGRQVKRTMIGYTEGYCISGKFKSISRLRESLVRIPKIKTPF
jgi:hypothetical protein